MGQLKLFMVLIGCKPAGRHTEQHDVFFGIGHSLGNLLGDMQSFWPEAKGRIHIDAWREVTHADGYRVEIIQSQRAEDVQQYWAEDVQQYWAEDVQPLLFFLNLGGYKENEFEEFHYKMLSVCNDISVAVKQAKQTVFYKHAGFKGAESHIDDKYGIDVDDIYRVTDILPAAAKQQYKIMLTEDRNGKADEWHIGYLKLSKARDMLS